MKELNTISLLPNASIPNPISCFWSHLPICKEQKGKSVKRNHTYIISKIYILENSMSQMPLSSFTDKFLRKKGNGEKNYRLR